MKHFSLNAWSDWRWVSRSYMDVTWIRINTDYLRGHFVSVDFVLLGLGFSLTFYFDPASTKWTAWEPIEHDGCAGVPEQGMEKAP